MQVIHGMVIDILPGATITAHNDRSPLAALKRVPIRDPARARVGNELIARLHRITSITITGVSQVKEQHLETLYARRRRAYEGLVC